MHNTNMGLPIMALFNTRETNLLAVIQIWNISVKGFLKNSMNFEHLYKHLYNGNRMIMHIGIEDVKHKIL